MLPGYWSAPSRRTALSKIVTTASECVGAANADNSPVLTAVAIAVTSAGEEGAG